MKIQQIGSPQPPAKLGGVEVLIQAFDKIDLDKGRTLLRGLSNTTIYEAALTLMMRLVFLFSAEERGLLLLDDPIYSQYYAVSTLGAQLREVADQQGEEILQYRCDAWCRLLATFRAVFAGIQHDVVQLRAYGGRLFDPNRFPFLEGRSVDTSWLDTLSDPIPVNNRTVLHYRPLEKKFIPYPNAVAEENPETPQLQPPTPYEIRAELEKAVLNDLLGSAGGEEEELDEDSVSDRYLVGLLAPQQRRVSPEQQEELAVAGKGTAEEGSTDTSVSPTETMFPSSFGMSFCVSDTAKALQVTVAWGQYERTNSETLTKKDNTPKRVWKRRQIRETSPPIPLVEGEISKWTVHSEFTQVYVQGRVCKQTSGDWIVSLFLVNGQKEPAKLRDEAWLFQPELSVESASRQPDIFLKRHQPRLAGKLDPLVYTEEQMMAMLYRHKVEFAIGHGVSVHAGMWKGGDDEELGCNVTQRAVKLSTSVVPASEVPKTSPPNVSEIPQLAGLVLDMKELSQTPTADFAMKLSPLVTAYASWIEDEEKRISNPNEGLADYQDAAKRAIANCKRALERIRQGLVMLQVDQIAEAFRFMNQAMYLQRIHSIYAEKVRQGQDSDLAKIVNPTWFPS